MIFRRIHKSDKKSALEEFINYAAPKYKYGLLYQICYETAAWLCILFIIISLLAFGMIINELQIKRIGLGFFDRLIVNFLGYAPAFGFGIAFGYLRSRGKRYGADFQGRLLKDPRRPVLYLRPFSVEIEEGAYYRRDSIEVLLAKELNHIGPVVAVGLPNQAPPIIGAIRLFFSDEEWKEKVEILMEISQLIIIQGGDSKGIEWEIETALKRNYAEKVAFSFLHWHKISLPSHKVEYEHFQNIVNRITNIALPATVENAYFMYFDNLFRVYLSFPNKSKSTFLVGRITKPKIRKSLSPILKRIKVE